MNASLVAVRLSRLFATKTIADRPSWALPVTAQAIVTALTLIVIAGVRWFTAPAGPETMLYTLLAVLALILLVVPLATLAAAAARLSATRRDTRLSSLRLLGGTTATVRLLTVIETAATALAGSFVGVLGYLALTPAFGQLRFRGGVIGAEGLWLGVLPIAGCVLAIVTLAVLSSAVGLRRVEISPLGVRTRQQAPRLHWVRMLVGSLVFVIALVAVSSVKSAPGLGAGIAMLMVMFALPMAALNLIGPWVLGVVTRRDARRARTAVQLLAARSVLENPKQLWRQIGALALTSFVAVFCGVALSFSRSEIRNPSDKIVMDDVGTGALLTLAIAFVTVACSVGLNQAAAILDRRCLHVGLDLIGMPFGAIDAARRRAVLRPLVGVVSVSAGAAALLLAPLVGVTYVVDVASLLTIAVTLATGIGFVVGSLWLTRLTLRSVIRAGVVRAE